VSDGPYAPWVALAQEPWKFPPETLANLTRRQCVELYLKPAAERAKEMEATGGGAEPARWDWSKGVPPRADFVAAMISQGHTPERAGEIWDRMKAAEGATNGKG
jgi:hypothetical protein